ncbi:LLM class F420-dependent oxidoreductase [Williamsia sp. 1135]|uniref:LLM class F420-dependent oxidoreductase n=1 Tax=Williamsia sp. 1135 TaxID=1889262 RepID=UPI000A11A8BF|nr:LLM class F420-dependent oxidoreductase [Williamsia sp. 1135]ORM34744.1 LLM class F420-dependent oxidoreductase [Williamsia sp. 1135]
MRFGYTLMTEQSGPKDLVRYATAAEKSGFDFEVMSDHYSPWLVSQGHAPYAWSVLGAVAHATERVELATYVTAPTIRYHPAVVAQKAATIQLLADGRFILGLGSGENLNEHTVGQGWPSVDERHDMFVEAVEVIRALHSGDLVTYSGNHFRVDSSRIWDLPDGGIPIGIAVSGEKSVKQLAPLGDHLIATDPKGSLVSQWDDHHEGPSRKIGQIPICWGTDKKTAVARAHDQFRWFAGGWSVNADLPTTASFAGATQFVRPEDVESSIACGPDLDELAESVRPFLDAGFTDVALVQIGGDSQDEFLAKAAEPLLEKLRGL